MKIHHHLQDKKKNKMQILGPLHSDVDVNFDNLILAVTHT